MKVPAAGVIALERRPAHERGEMSHPAADLPRRGAKEERMICRLERRPRGEGTLDLSRSPLVLDRSQRQPDFLEMLGERGEHRLHQVHVGFAMIGKARLDWRSLDRPSAHAGDADILVAQFRLRDAQQVPLDFQPHDEVHTLVREPLEVLAQQLPGREMERHAAVEIFVAQHPADAARPRQHAKGRRIGNDGEIGRARHLGETHPAAARERGEGAGIGGIEGGGRDIDVVAGLERGEENRRRDRLGARGAVRIGPDEAHKMQIVLLDPALEIVGLPPLLVGPHPMPCDEWERLFHLHHSVRPRGRVAM